MRVEVATLSFGRAIDIIKSQETVFLRRGVWNEYKLVSVESAISSIQNSGYGADVYYDDATEMYYVSIPSSGDMW